jgi:hypothetical protein
MIANKAHPMHFNPFEFLVQAALNKIFRDTVKANFDLVNFWRIAKRVAQHLFFLLFTCLLYLRVQYLVSGKVSKSNQSEAFALAILVSLAFFSFWLLKQQKAIAKSEPQVH